MSIRSSRREISARIRPLYFTWLLCLCGIVPAAFAQDNWLGGVGNWSDNTKWSAGVPTNSSNVFIDHGLAGASPVTLNTNGSAANVTIDSDDSLTLHDGTTLTIGSGSGASTIANAGTINISSAGSGTWLAVNNAPGGVTLTGTGTLKMSNISTNGIGIFGGSLTNKSTIQGAGLIGNTQMGLNNQGTINANIGGSGANPLTLNPVGTGVNTGTLEATNGGTLQLQSGFNNVTGKIQALGSGSQVILSANTSFSGGTFTTSSGGVILVQGTSSEHTAELDGSTNTVTNSGTIAVFDGSTLALNGTINNTATIQLNAVSSQTLLDITGSLSAATLTGGGTVALSNNANNALGAFGGTLTNANNTIQGAGQIGSNQMALVNQGTIDANIGGGGANPLIINTVGTGTNTGTMEATNGGTLAFQSSFNNTGGTIEASGAGSFVTLGPNLSINGGTITTSGGGVVLVTGTSSEHAAVLEGSPNAVTNAGLIQVADGSTILLDGTINNTGTILLNAVSSLTLLDFNGAHGATLTGKGKIALSNNSNNALGGFGGNLTNLNNTIQGAGQIGNTQAGIINRGKILANQTTPLIIDGAGFTNFGTLMVNKGSVMNINDAFSNFSGTTLTGGTYSVSGTLVFNGANIVTLAAHVSLSGATSAIMDQSNNDALRNFASITSKGSLALHSGRNLTTPGSISNAGGVTVGAGTKLNITGSYTQSGGTTTVDGTLTAPSGTTITAGKVFGNGTIASTVVSSGSVTAGDSLLRAGRLSPSTYTQNSGASLNIQLGGTTVRTQYSQLAVANGASLNGILNVTLINKFVPAVGDVFTIVTASIVSGQFSTVNLPVLSGAHWVVTYNPTNVTLTVVSG